MTHGSLFSGIGGFDLAAEWMGWTNLFHCEWNPFGQQVLKHYWPEAELFTDITKTNFTKYANRIDVLSGGFPCQPYSVAGKRLGKDDERHLWPEMLRAIREIQPRWVIGENVSGLVNWNGGMVFNEVQADLEAEGYEVIPFILPAAGVNAPHRRDRVWFVAYNNSIIRGAGWNAEPGKQSRHRESVLSTATSWPTTYPDIINGRTGTGRENGQETGNGSEGVTAHPDRSGLQAQRPEQSAAGITGGGVQRPTPHPESNEDQRRGSGGFHTQFTWACDEGIAAHPDSQRYEKRQPATFAGIPERQYSQNGIGGQPPSWQNFPTQPPIRKRDDGVSGKLAKFVVNEFYETVSKTSKENRIENLPEMWKRVQQEEVWREIRRLYSLESKEVLFKTMQLYQTGTKPPDNLSPFSEKFSKTIMRKLRKYGEFRSTPLGQKLQKQRSIEFENTLSFLPHEIPLAARAFEAAISKFETWHRNESIKAYGNAVVPQVVFQIFKAIQSFKNPTP